MKTKLFTLLVFVLSLSSIEKVIAQELTEDNIGKTIVTLKTVGNFYDVDTIIPIRFEVINLDSKEISFCKRNTPLEGQFIAPFFTVEHNGKQISYSGKSFQRMAPTNLEYVKVGSMQMTTAEIDLKEGYDIKEPGEYIISFVGDKINGLPDSEPLIISVK